MTLIDKDGVPRLIQKVKYVRKTMLFEFMLFDGRVLPLPSEMVSPTVGMMQFSPSHEQMQDAYIEADRFLSKYMMTRLFPNEPAIPSRFLEVV